jgi:hypothetical protein
MHDACSIHATRLRGIELARWPGPALENMLIGSWGRIEQIVRLVSNALGSAQFAEHVQQCDRLGSADNHLDRQRESSLTSEEGSSESGVFSLGRTYNYPGRHRTPRSKLSQPASARGANPYRRPLAAGRTAARHVRA